MIVLTGETVAVTGQRVSNSPVKMSGDHRTDFLQGKNSWNRISAKYMKLSVPYWLVSSNNKMVGELNL